MSVSRFAKTIAYVAAAMAVTVLAVWMAAPLYAAGLSDEPMYTSAGLVAGYLRSVVLLFVTACGVLGVGVYSFFAYTRRHREHRRDSWFLLAVGGVMLLAAVVVICRFGGMSEENFTTDSYAAINLNLMLIGALPLPFLVRAAIVACGVRGRTQRIVVWALIAAAVVFFVSLAATGHLLHTIPTREIADEMTFLQ